MPGDSAFSAQYSVIFVSHRFVLLEQQCPRLLLVSHRVLEIPVFLGVYGFLEVPDSFVYQGAEALLLHWVCIGSEVDRIGILVQETECCKL